MQAENAIEVKNITKSFKVYLDRGETLKEKVIFKNRRKYEERKVLNGISFSVKKGEAVGLIGHNGCGKSTTLKMLTKIMYPDSGSIEMRGRISSLIELGAGFHPDMSGRENIYINASIFGLTRKEIDARIEDIIEFSELGEFIDNPVRTYSSGMYMRLAFSVAINVDADILLVDEILAVGDVAFQSKCFNRLREIKGEGTTIVIVSHSMGQIEDICDQSIWIDKGKIRKIGIPREVDRAYLDYMREYSMSKEDEKNKKKESIKVSKLKTTKKSEQRSEQKNECINPLMVKVADDKNKVISIENIRMMDSDGKEKHDFATGENALLSFDYKVLVDDDKKEKISIELAFIRNDGVECYETNTFREGIELMDLKGDGTIRCKIDRLNLIDGEYYLEIAFRKPDGFPYDYKEKAYKIRMRSLNRERGIVKIDHTWDFKGVING